MKDSVSLEFRLQTIKVVFVGFLLFLGTPIQSTNADQQQEKTVTYAKNDCAATPSEEQLFCITFSSNVQPIPVNRIHGWTLHLENAQGEPVDNAKILVYGGMPAHKHGFPTNPQVTENMGGGNYLLDGVKFSMHGKWEIWLNITDDKIRDKAVFEVNVM